MAKNGKNMADRIAEGGHYVPTSAPSLNKGQFQQVGSFIDEGDFGGSNKGTSVNVKTGKLQNGEN